MFAQIISQTPPVRVAKVQATTLPALGGLFGGLLFALGAALLVDRADRTIRDPGRGGAHLLGSGAVDHPGRR